MDDFDKCMEVGMGGTIFGSVGKRQCFESVADCSRKPAKRTQQS